MGNSKKRIQYTYDALGNRSVMVDPDAGRFTYAYDSLSRITSVINPQSERTSYSYDANNRRTVKLLANGTRASFTYNDANRLTTLGNLKSDGSVISQFDYSYDAAGNRTSVVEADGSRTTWLYDDTYQLTDEHRTGTNAYRNTFSYDPAGNRTLKNEGGVRTTYAYDNANQLRYGEMTGGRTTYTFDADGNQQLVTEPSGNRTTTTWDYENRTTLVELPSSVRNTMAYEPDGLRVKLADSTGTKKFIWDNQNYLAEADSNNDIQVVYTNEPALYGNLLSQRRGTTTHWFHFDTLGSTRELTDSAENVTDTYLYDAWGNLISSTGSTVNPFLWTGSVGYYFDSVLGTFYIRARAYSPMIGRWLSVDPLWFVDGANLYRANFIPSRVDPSGSTPVTYIPGRGVFVRAHFEDDSISGFSSDLTVEWKPFLDEFLASGPDCCRCQDVSFIQIIETTFLCHTLYLPCVSLARSWHIDRRRGSGVPWYPFQTPGLVCPQFGRANMTDQPGFDKIGGAHTITQKAELCVACSTSSTASNIPERYVEGEQLYVYGCLKWSHSYRNGKYCRELTPGGKPMCNSDKKVPFSTAAWYSRDGSTTAGDAPSSLFKRIVGQDI